MGMGTDDGGIRILCPEEEPLIRVLESKAPGVRVSSFKEWTSLRKFVEVLRVADLEIKADVLRHLCYFLSSSAATIKYPSPTSAENVSLSAVVGDREVYVDYDELVALHDLLFLELALRIPLFSAENEKFAESLSAFPSTLQELKVAALTLRCCIRLLPLIELFDTGLRNAMGVGLDNLLQKLCSPTEPCLLPTKVYSSEMITSNIKPFRAPLLCALLEVFVDELLCRSKTQLLLVQDGISEKGTKTSSRLTLEALLAHVMISAQSPKGPHERRTRPCELSLQSAVMLLDKVITDNAPRYLLSHVVRIVSQGLEDSMCTPENLQSSEKAENQKRWFSRFPISGYSNNAESCEMYTNYVPDSLSRRVSLWLVSSVLERGVSLYMKYAAAPHLANFVSVLDDRPQPPAVSSTLLASCLWSYVCHRGRMNQECEAALESMLNDATLRKGLEECMDQTDQAQIQGHGPGQGTDRILKAVYLDGSIERSSGTHFCGKELYNVPVWEEDHSTLIADVLHLMHSALNFITEKVRSMEETCQASLAGDMTKEDIDDIWLGLIGSFHKCLPCDGEITAADSLGHVLVFFTDMLYYEAETTISDDRLREYLELLESLLISLLMEHYWRKSTSNPLLPVHNYGQKGMVDVTSDWEQNSEKKTSPSFYARRVVSLLQGFLEEPDLMEILGANAVSIILQINCFWNDFCEFMDKVLSTNDWREYIPANGRRISKKILKTVREAVREADIVDRNVEEENFDHDMQFLEELPSPDEREFRQRPADFARQQSRDDYREPAEHQPCSLDTGLEKQQLRPSTLPILQRLMKHRSRPAKPRDVSPERKPVLEAEVTTTRGARPVRKCRQKTEDETSDIPTEAEGNPFVAEVLLLEKTSENFDDLNDFIVCKQGRSYTRWLNRRTKFRRRKRTREIWKRAEEKKRLLSMLSIV